MRASKKRGRAPAWAIKLCEQVCQEEGVRVPSIRWRVAYAPPQQVSPTVRAAFNIPPTYLHSSGRAWYDWISITAGNEKRETKIVLLHELAHVIRMQKRDDRSHGSAFYEVAWRLWRRHRCGFDNVIAREAHYKVECLKTAVRLKIPGAKNLYHVYSNKTKTPRGNG